MNKVVVGRAANEIPLINAQWVADDRGATSVRKMLGAEVVNETKELRLMTNFGKGCT